MYLLDICSKQIMWPTSCTFHYVLWSSVICSWIFVSFRWLFVHLPVYIIICKQHALLIFASCRQFPSIPPKIVSHKWQSKPSHNHLLNVHRFVCHVINVSVHDHHTPTLTKLPFISNMCIYPYIHTYVYIYTSMHMNPYLPISIYVHIPTYLDLREFVKLP